MKNYWKNRQIKSLKKLGYTRDSLLALRRLENRAHKLAEQYCNGDIDSSIYDQECDRIINRVKALFGGNLPGGFFINGDPRGYALKLDNNLVTIPEGIQRDWGGFGILAPES